MSLSGRIAAAALAAAFLQAAPAAAAEYCVGPDAPCLATLADALEAARLNPGADRVLLGAGEHEVPAAPADAAGEPVELVGTGPTSELVPAGGSTVTLELREPTSRAAALAVRAPAGGMAVALSAGTRLTGSRVSGPVSAAGPARVERTQIVTDGSAALTMTGSVLVESSIVAVAGSAAFDVQCGELSGRGLTVVGTAPAAITGGCPSPGTAAASLRDSVLAGDFEDVAPATVATTSSHSAHAEDADVTATARLALTDPGFVSASDLRPGEGSPLIDAGDPEPLRPGEGHWDLGNLARAADGDGDGVLRRDVGAHERQPAAETAPQGNVLFNPGGELADPLMGTGEGPEPAGWTRTGGFTTVGYGSTAGDITLPTREAGQALGAGRAFFSAGPGPAATLVQRVDIAASGAEIDTGQASAGLSGLLGGYGADEDEVRVTATFRDPAGNPIGALQLGPVPPAERANGTNLLPRRASGAIPPRTRAIDVEVAGARVSAPGSSETYADAYADNLALVLSVPGVPMPGPLDPEEPPVKNLRPFAGVTVLTARPRMTPKGRVRIRVACASATVGSCAGSLELRARLRRGAPVSRIAQYARFRLAPGRAATVTVKLHMAARRPLRRARSFRATLRAVARDGQALERRRTIPVRVRRLR